MIPVVSPRENRLKVPAHFGDGCYYNNKEKQIYTEKGSTAMSSDPTDLWTKMATSSTYARDASPVGFPPAISSRSSKHFTDI